MVAPKEIHTNIKSLELVEKRQKQICDVATRLFVKNGFHGTSIRDIAHESGIGIGSIYDYFRNKEEILFLAHKNIVELNYVRIKESLMGLEDPIDRIIRAIETQFNLVDEQQDFYLFIYEEGHLLDAEFKKEIMKIEQNTISLFEGILKEGQAKGVFRSFNCRVAANMIVLLNHGWVLKRWDLKNVQGSKLVFVIDFALKGISC
jgi:AcrR family transcriptional regulator